ncbi:MAG: phage antirepressor N-terminal domain-containing protein [Candidatus Promineifilaceae bacterium]|jgi:ferritin-like metal-binding protein YciE|nr:ORF6C domain-containing protein [Chloroflexota bacterium]
MSEDKALVPVEQRQVEFYEDEITAVRLPDGRVFVPVRPLVESLGLSWSSQLQRIRRDSVLKSELLSVFVTNTESERGGRDVQCLPLDYISGFLFGINAERVRDDLRERVIRYQRECYRVLAEAFTEGRLTTDADLFDLLDNEASEAVQAYKMLQALVKLARNQIVIEARLEKHGQTLEDHGRRLETIEADLHQANRTVTEAQATQISQSVRAIAIVLGKKSNRNEFGAVWGEFYRKFGVSKYRYLPAARFDEALAWLNEFYQSVTSELPF